VRRARRTPRGLLAVPVFGQNEGECGNTTLKAVAWYHGRRFSARRLAALCHATADGVDHAMLVAGARKTGGTVFTKVGGTLGELAHFVTLGYPVIIGWWDRDPEDPPFSRAWSLRERRANDCGHYSVVVGVTADGVWLMDPQWELRKHRLHVIGYRRLSRAALLASWYDTDTDRYVKVARWYMVVNYEGRRFAAEIRGGKDFAARGTGR
jgi:ABC-type bacteriocin/lantibiotic exporter with double-glycine peptidase domain